MSPAEQLARELGAPRGDRDGRRLVPMLCERDDTSERLLTQEGWLFELKLDGVRIVADKRGSRVALGYRKVRDATDSYPEIAEAVAKLADDRLVLDGEIVAFDESGKPDFQRLGTRIQSRGEGARRAAFTVPVAFVVFDVLVVGEHDVTGLPIEARKRILEAIVGDAATQAGHVRTHPTFAGGADLFRLCREHGLEGVVAKRAGSAYRPDDRSADWVKIKCEQEADLVVIGWTEGDGRRARLGALDLAAYEGERLVVRGSVGSGLDEETIDHLTQRLAALEVKRPVAEGTYRPKRGRRHVRPDIVVSVRHLGMSADGLMRHPVFRGIRHDLDPRDCIVARPAAGTGVGARADAPRRMRVTALSQVVLEDGTTKGALCSYYEAVAPAMLPYLRGRICPLLCAAARVQKGARGTASPTRLWPLPSWTPSWVRRCVARRGREEVRGVIVEDVDTLLFLVEAGCASLLMSAALEAAPSSSGFVALHIEGASAWRLALRARELVTATGLTAFVKASGALSYDVLAPVGAAPADAVHMLAVLLARLLSPYAAELGASVEPLDAPVAPYALLLPLGSGLGATASMPLSWDEVASEAPHDGAANGADASATLDLVRERIERGGVDPMLGLLSAPADFAQAIVAIEAVVAAGGEGDEPGP